MTTEELANAVVEALKASECTWGSYFGGKLDWFSIDGTFDMLKVAEKLRAAVPQSESQK